MSKKPNNAWTKKEIYGYLNAAKTPIRLACIDKNNQPTICSLWFIFENGILWCASHKNSHIIKLLKSNKKIGFEISTNNYPYKGVRGKGSVELITIDADTVLNKLVNKYLDGTNQTLSTWLLSRSSDEYAIKIQPQSLSSWDFSNRMTQQQA